MDQDIGKIIQEWAKLKRNAKKRVSEKKDMESEDMSSPDLDTKKPKFQDMGMGEQIEYVSKRRAEQESRPEYQRNEEKVDADMEEVKKKRLRASEWD